MTVLADSEVSSIEFTTWSTFSTFSSCIDWDVSEVTVSAAEVFSSSDSVFLLAVSVALCVIFVACFFTVLSFLAPFCRMDVFFSSWIVFAALDDLRAALSVLVLLSERDESLRPVTEDTASDLSDLTEASLILLLGDTERSLLCLARLLDLTDLTCYNIMKD